MPFPPSELTRLRQLGDRILFGSDFPNIPHDYVDAMRSITQLAGIDDDWPRCSSRLAQAPTASSPDSGLPRNRLLCDGAGPAQPGQHQCFGQRGVAVKLLSRQRMQRRQRRPVIT